MSLELCYYNLLFPQSFRARIHIDRIHFCDDGELIDMCGQLHKITWAYALVNTSTLDRPGPHQGLRGMHWALL
jgi:hypothetical protein